MVDQKIRCLKYEELTLLDRDGRRWKKQNREIHNIDWFTYSQIISCFKYDKRKYGYSEEKSEWYYIAGGT